MKVKIEYKGPDVHDRSISRKDLEAAGVEFPEGVTFPTLNWAADTARVPVRLTDEGDDALPTSVIEEVLDVLKKDPVFRITEDGKVTQEEHPDSGHTLADGSNAASGTGGSEALRRSIGDDQISPPPSARGAGDTATGAGKTSDVGGSTRTKP